MECEGSKFHTPRPLLVHRMTLEDGRDAWLCGVCVGNVTVYQRLRKHAGGTVPWPVAREFGNTLRAVVEGRPRNVER